MNSVSTCSQFLLPPFGGLTVRTFVVCSTVGSLSFSYCVCVVLLPSLVSLLSLLCYLNLLRNFTHRGLLVRVWDVGVWCIPSFPRVPPCIPCGTKQLPVGV